jgi:hypothetical protein
LGLKKQAFGMRGVAKTNFPKKLEFWWFQSPFLMIVGVVAYNFHDFWCPGDGLLWYKHSTHPLEGKSEHCGRQHQVTDKSRRKTKATIKSRGPPQDALLVFRGLNLDRLGFKTNTFADRGPFVIDFGTPLWQLLGDLGSKYVFFVPAAFQVTFLNDFRVWIWTSGAPETRIWCERCCKNDFFADVGILLNLGSNIDVFWWPWDNFLWLWMWLGMWLGSRRDLGQGPRLAECDWECVWPLFVMKNVIGELPQPC